jgi:hypothetical protein
MSLGFDPETGIYNDHPRGRWPLHIMRPTSTGHFTWYQTCPTPYVAPMTTDPEAFWAAMEQGRAVCEYCTEWLKEQGKSPEISLAL